MNVYTLIGEMNESIILAKNSYKKKIKKIK